MRINYNVSSIIARNALNNNDTRLSASIKKLSSGYKINSAKDNAASLAIARKMNAQINSIKRGNQNANDGVSVVNTADGAMAEMHDILQRMNELAIQSANGTNSDSDRLLIQKEIDQLVVEIDRIADTTQFNSQNLLDGTFAYKGYSNSENVRVKSYSDGVVSGTYVMEKLVYHHYDEYTTYTNSNASAEHSERFVIDSIDDLKDWLVTRDEVEAYNLVANISGIQGFPNINDLHIEIDKEDIIITGRNDFEVKIALNNKENINGIGGAAANVTSTTVTIERYKGVTVTIGSTTISISDVSIEMEQLPSGTTNINKTYVGNGYESLNSLKEDFEDYFTEMGYDVKSIDSFEYNPATNSFTMEVTLRTPTNPPTKLSIPMNVSGNITNYTYSTTVATKTTFTIDDDIQFNLTGKGPMRIQVGPTEGQVIAVEIPALNAVYLRVNDFDVTTEDKATEAINIVGKAINMLSGVRAKIGAYTNRLERTIKSLDTTDENLTQAYSRIMDTDMAVEMTEYTTMQVLVQSATAMLAQANERPQQVLQLIQ